MNATDQALRSRIENTFSLALDEVFRIVDEVRERGPDHHGFQAMVDQDVEEIRFLVDDLLEKIRTV